MTPNKKQIELVNAVRAGELTTPTKPEELASWLGQLLLTRDFDLEEFESITKCKVQFIRTVKQKVDSDGWTYLSIIKNTLSSRAYFQSLRTEMKKREIDAMRHITQSMLKDGLIKRVGPKVMITNAAREYLTNNEF